MKIGRTSSQREAAHAHNLRCRCLGCGAHVLAWTAGHVLSGECGVCGSYEIAALPEVVPVAGGPPVHGVSA